MKILLTTLNSKFIHTCLSIRYLKSYCKDKFPGIYIEEYTINQNTDYIAREIYKQSPDIVAFSSYIWNMTETLEIAEILKTVNPNIIIILGGPEVTYNGEEVLRDNSFIDYIIFGEGEETLKHLLSTIEDKGDFKLVEGIIYKEKEKICINAPRPLIQDLDSISSPFDDDIETFKNKIAYFESSRGCPFNCQFCLSSSIKGVRFFSLERAKSDLKKLIDIGVDQIKFVDRTFNAKKGYAMEIMNFIREQNTKGINFHFEVTAHLVDDEMLVFLENVEEGLFQFEVGVQSTNAQTLEAIDRTTDFEKLSRVVNRINSFKNIHLHLDLIAGLPYENYESFRNSFNDVYALNPHKLQLGFLKVLRGSGLWDKTDEYGFKFIDVAPYEILETAYISYGEISRLKDLEDMVEKYGNEWYFKNTIDYIIKHYFETPFDFFEGFASYWESKEYHKVSHSRRALYEKLYEFIAETLDIDKLLVANLIKYDFLLNNKTATLPEFLRNDYKDDLKTSRHGFLQDENNLKQYLPDYADTPVKRILNDVHFEMFDYNVKDLVDSDKITGLQKDKRTYLFLYHGDKYHGDKNALDISTVHDITKDI